jgi:hypothetical protein
MRRLYSSPVMIRQDAVRRGTAQLMTVGTNDGISVAGGSEGRLVIMEMLSDHRGYRNENEGAACAHP